MGRVQAAGRRRDARCDARRPSTPTTSRSALDELDFGDPLMARNIEAAKRVLSRDIPILRRRNGNGKELFGAPCTRKRSADKPFVAVNCASMPEAEIQIELFGLVREGSPPQPEGRPGKSYATAAPCSWTRSATCRMRSSSTATCWRSAK